MSLGCYKIGILSTAYIAHNGIVRPAKKRNDVQITAIASRCISRAREYASKFDIPHVHGSYQQLLESDVDIIYICLPNSLHYEWTKKALLSGKHVLCEKPMVPCYDKALELINIAKSKKLMLADGMHYRYYPACKDLLTYFNRINEQIISIEARIGFPLPSYPNIRLQPECLGGAFMHLICYLIDALFTIFPGMKFDVEEVRSKYFNTGADLWTKLGYTINGSVKGSLLGSFLESHVSSYLFVHTKNDVWTVKHFYDPTIIIGEDDIIDKVTRVIEIYKNGEATYTQDLGLTTYDYQLEEFMRNVTLETPVPESMVNIETCSLMEDCLPLLDKPGDFHIFHC